MTKLNFIIDSHMAPGITTLNGVTYAVPGWHVIPEGTTLEEVHAVWKRPVYKEEKNTHSITEKVSSSNGDKTYEVSFDGKNWNCECVGFGFRRTCKHIETIKNKYKL